MIFASARFSTASLVLVMVVFGSWSLGDAFELNSTLVRPSLVDNPIEVVIWVKDGVTPENEARAVDQIRQGLRMLEDVPTSRLRFSVVQVVGGQTEPTTQPHQLLIIAGNRASFASGGASLPDEAGNPGTWFAAVADLPTLNLVTVAAHEVGHAVGLHHSTISITYPIAERPIMHFAVGSSTLRPDDVAALSWAYPEPALTLLDVGGMIHGRVVDAGTGRPITGVNVVAVDTASQLPFVARITGAAAGPGEFEIVGLPPGSYVLSMQDGDAYRGLLGEFDSFLSLNGGFQADAYDDTMAGPFTIAAGEQKNVGDLALSILPLSVAGVYIGAITPFQGSIPVTQISSSLPSAEALTRYEVWLHVMGGVRDLQAEVTGLPCGLVARIEPDPRVPNTGIHGSQYLRIEGTPVETGAFQVRARIIDGSGTVHDFTWLLEVTGSIDGPVTFVWDPIATPQTASEPVPVRVTALGPQGPVTGFAGSVRISASTSPDMLELFADDFEDGNFDGWRFGVGPYVRRVTSATAAEGSVYSLTLQGGGALRDGLSRQLGAIRPAHISFQVRLSSAGASARLDVAGGGDSVPREVIVFQVIGGVMGLQNGNIFAGVPYTSNEWHRVDIDIDWAAKTLDWHLNGHLVEAGLAFAFNHTDVESLSAVFLYHLNNTQTWWDEIRFFDGTAGRRIQLQSTVSGNFTGGVWTGTVKVKRSAPQVHLKVDVGACGTVSNGFDVRPSPYAFSPNGAIDVPASDLTVSVGQPVHFYGSFDAFGDPSGVQAHWDFGGGAPDSRRLHPGPVVFRTPGTYTVALRVVDSFGVADASPPTRRITVAPAPNDATPPTHVQVTAPTSGQTIAGMFALRATAQDDSGSIQRMEFYVGGTSTPSCSDATPKASGATFQCDIDTRTVPDGSHAIRARAVDPSGNAADSALVAVTLDNTSPQTTITAGPNGTVTTNMVSFTWIGSDNLTPLASLLYAFRLDPLEPAFSAFGNATSRPYADLANGSYTFYVKTRDLAGNETAPPASRAFAVNADSTAPVAGPLVVSRRNAGYVGSPFDLSMTFTDTESAVVTCQYTTDGGTSWSTAAVTGAQPTFACVKAGITGSNGQRLTVNMRATSGGGTSQGTAVQVRVDGVSPTGSVKINGGASYATSPSVSLGLSVADAASGVSEVCVTNTNASCSAWRAYATTLAWTLSAGDGTKTVYVWARDRVGNVTPNPFTDQIALDTTGPTNPTTVTSTSHTPGVWSPDRTVDMKWSGATDQTSGVSGYSISWTTSPTTLPDAKADTTSTQKTSPSLPEASNHYFHLRTQDAAGNWAAAAVHQGPFMIDRTSPVNGTLTATPGSRQVSLAWSSFSDAMSGLAPANTYRLVVSTAGNPGSTCSSGTEIFRGTATAFTHTDLATGTTYYYRVCAVDEAGNVSTGTTRSAIAQ